MSSQPLRLFHPRTLNKAYSQAKILKDNIIPAKPLAILKKWNGLIESGQIKQQKEVQLQSSFISELCVEVLGYKPMTKAGKTGKWTLIPEERVGKGSVDVCLGSFSHTDKQQLVMFELKGADTSNMDIAMKGRKKSTVEQARKYALDANGKAQWFMVSNCVEIRLYKFPESNDIYESWQIKDLIQPEEYQRFMLLLGHKQLITGKTEKLYKQSLDVEKDITNDLYADYREIRIKLINGMKRENNRIRRADMVKRAQTLLDRVLFIAFAEDRDLLPAHTLSNYLNGADEFKSGWDQLKLLFKDIKYGEPRRNIPLYNGDLFAENPELEELKISDDLLMLFKKLWEYDFATDISETILGHIFEQSIADLDQIYETITEDNELLLEAQAHGTTGKRKKDGVVYTPDFITHWIVEQALGSYLDKCKQAIEHEPDSLAWWQAYRDRLAVLRICDPACGSGAFLVAAFKYLKEEYKVVNTRLDELGETGDLVSKDLNDDILNNNLFGVDINAESVEIARLSLWLATAEKGKKLISLKNNIKQGNSIIHHKSTDKNAFIWAGKFTDFDVVLGNPPYVRQERLSDIKPYLEKHYQTYHGVADLYTYFFELGLKILRKDGHLGYISSSTFFKTGSGEALRKHLSIEANLKQIVDFGDLQVFEGVTTYPAILVMSKPTRSRKTAPENKLAFWNIAANKLDDLKTEMQSPKWGEMGQHKLALDGWRLEDERLQALRQKIVRNKPTLKEVYGSPLYGIKTGRNEAFVIDQGTRDEFIEQDPRSLEIIKPFLEGKDLKKWRAEPRDLYLIFTRRGIDIEQYPAVKNHLEKYREILEPKPKDFPKGKKWLGRKAGTYKWYEIQDSVDYFSNFESKKINYGHFSPSPLFAIDGKGFFSNDKSYIISDADSFLLGLLNSPVHWFLIQAMCPFVRGGYYEVRIYFIETLPIPKATNTQKQTIATLAEECQQLAESRYKLENQLRKLIPSLCPANREAKLNNKLKSWWLLSFNDFQAEIKKQFKQAIPLADRAEWDELFNSNKTTIQSKSAQLAVKEQALNQAVYDLFGLDANEIALLEESLK